MRKLTFLLVALSLVAVSLYGCDETTTEPGTVELSPVTADPGASFNAVSAFPEGVQGGAIVQNFGQDPQIRCGWGGQYLSDTRHWVLTPSGKEKLVCHFRDLPPIPRTFIWKGWNCTIRSGVFTTNTSWVRTPSGNATVTCIAE